MRRGGSEIVQKGVRSYLNAPLIYLTLKMYYGLLNKRTRAVIFLGLFAQAVQAYSGRAFIYFFKLGPTVRLFRKSNLHGYPSTTKLDR